MSDVFVKRARALARSLSEDIRVVGLLADLPDEPASLEAVVELASALGRSRRTLLANLSGSASGLDAFLEAEEAEGLAAVLRGDGKLGEVAVRPGIRPFLYLPAGDVPSFRPWLGRGAATPGEAPDPGAGADEASPLHVLLERLTERIRRAEAVLVLYLPAELARTGTAADLLDGLVSLSGQAASEARDTGLPVVGVRGPEAPVPTPEPSDAAAEDASAGPSTSEPESGSPSGPSAPSAREAEPRARWELEDADPEEEATPARAEQREPEAEAEEAAENGSAADRWEKMTRDDDAEAPASAGSKPAAGGAGAGTGEGSAGEGSGDEDRWRRHRRSGTPPWGRIALGAAAILVLAIGWWALARTTSGGVGDEVAGGDVATPAAAGETGGGGEEPGAVAPGDSARDTAVANTEGEPPAAEPLPPAESVADSAPELSHSVLVASYADPQEARRRADAWSREDEALYFVAPTRIDGRVYHRLFSGAHSSAGAARRAMERLVELGRKDSVRAWDARPAGLAHRAGVTRDEGEATRLRDELTGEGVPAYVLEAVADGDTVYQVYAGAYVRAGQSALEETLSGMGRVAPLVTRRGAPRTP